jgi:hypothetical protein
MGLSIFVGMLADHGENDREGCELLAEAGVPAHTELERCASWDAEMFGDSGLHDLRRLAVHLELRGTLPPPGDEQDYNVATGTGWQRYGIEAFSCVRLLHGAQHSVAQRAALVFA